MKADNKKLFILWVKIIVISWLIFSTALYLLSGNVLVFYANGIIFLAGGIPYLILELLHLKHSRNKNSEGKTRKS